MLARHRLATAAVAGAGVLGGALYFGLSWDVKEGDAQVKLQSDYDETAETAPPEPSKTTGRDPAETMWHGSTGTGNQKGI